jgi:anti-sigma B factor antagonist
MLKAWVENAESGPVVMLAGEADLAGAAQIDSLITGQLAQGTRQLTIDVAGLRFAGAASIRTLAQAARTLTERGGGLVLLDPQYSVVKLMTMLDVDEMVTILRTKPRPATAGDRRAEPSSAQACTGLTREVCDEHGID